MKRLLFVFALLITVSCGKNSDDTPEAENSDLYFPPIPSTTWETTTPAEQGWDEAALDELYTYLEDENTRAFIILQNGKIAVEKYWGSTITNSGDFDASSIWYWASAGKTLTAFLCGIAQQKGLLDIDDKTSDYLGEGWTSASQEKEDLITIRHQLTMTTGLDYEVDNLDCTDPACLLYKADAGTQWFYHNAAYTLIEQVVSAAAGISYNAFTDNEVEAATGMNGIWLQTGDNNVYYSTARDAARFGLLLLNKGTWDQTTLLSDQGYFSEMTNTSQDLNLSYGYLTWLNGKSSVILPGLTIPISTSIAPAAPADLFAALGKNGQFIDVVPSQNLVVIRMGEAPNDALVPVQLHFGMWEKIAAAISFD
ncbi:serine hydrolase domain-containing protein [Mangrovibacterium diazotrophicum]|uniref:CubicO group peptidase (Beta-lactamase class C family) n=1 Tax=Mangrovibacterium diazotrophicum TaxID=1261403 RepID=A0A419W8C3_9BACT|nr:serine hydrolase [Mangrovibacterium diazotrophicum]RKD91731.1 CubicO group peptidase (beta-lactamase class C family) [Mangrovibacterium diazotrophicum]